MIDPGLQDRVVLVTGANNPHGIGAAIASEFTRHGARLFLHGYREPADIPPASQPEPGLPFYLEQQTKSAGELYTAP